jgi:hypothetical protein
MTKDQISRDAQSFQDMIALAKTADPAYANALLGNVTSAAKTQSGALVVFVVAVAASHYGFNWSADTVTIVAGILMWATGFVLHWWQVLRYRKSLPLTPVNTSAVAPATLPAEPAAVLPVVATTVL